ncbi:MAG: hypothetical protein DMG88_21730 [Acidobacteria bacterium]|nr:MAG: hypothetical protein DMG88_21730 [Acidobacteriota bacterium]
MTVTQACDVLPKSKNPTYSVTKIAPYSFRDHLKQELRADLRQRHVAHFIEHDHVIVQPAHQHAFHWPDDRHAQHLAILPHAGVFQKLAWAGSWRHLRTRGGDRLELGSLVR